MRLLDIANEIVGYVKDFAIGHVAIEGFAFAAKYQAHQIGEISGAVITQLSLACGMTARKIPPLYGRKKILGYAGKLTKKQIFDAVYGGEVYVNNDHEADAWISAYTHFLDLAERGGEHEFCTPRV